MTHARDWYYEDGGRSRGPVTREQLTELLIHGFIPSTANVWTPAFGDSWRQAHDTDLIARPPAPPPLPVGRVREPPASEASNPPTPRLASGGLAGEPPRDTFAQLLAFSPLMYAAADFMAFANGIDPNGDNPVVNGIAICFFIGSVAAAIADANRIKVQGLNPTGRALAPFILLTPFGYFIRRNVLVPGSLRFLWIWLGCVLAFASIEGAMLPPDA